METQDKDSQLKHKEENSMLNTSKIDSEQKHVEADTLKDDLKSDDVSNLATENKENSSPIGADRTLYQSSVWESMDGGHFIFKNYMH